ncbi:hypothetical protein BSKO_00854 [Bryopsis sp. KO-2023]|nr:hypothetical protein BSKO_00854 [Bryopsis sp. KO-2023]
MSFQKPSRARERSKTKIVKPPPPEERLRRETRFIANISFRADLPEVVCEPKMITVPWRPSDLSRFKLTAVESQPRKDLLVQRNFGLPFNVSHRCPQFDVPEGKPRIGLEDLELLEQDGEDLDVDPETRLTTRKKTREGELSWLMRTTYISNQFNQSAAPPGVERQKPVDPSPEMEALDTFSGQVEYIQKSFDAQSRPAVHPKNPSLKAAEEWAVLPDCENWPLNFVTVAFDNDPTEDSRKLSGLSKHLREQISDCALLKSFDVKLDTRSAGMKDPNDSFVALMAPCDLRPENAPIPTCREDDVGHDGDYVWIKEYSYNVRYWEEDEKPTYLFKFSEGNVEYLDVSTRVVVKKRRTGVNVSRPSKVVLEDRPPDSRERKQRGERMAELQADLEGGEHGDFDEGYLEGEEDEEGDLIDDTHPVEYEEEEEE